MARGNKYRAVKTEVDGITFDSKIEAKRYGQLKLMERAGEISDLTCQPKYRIEINGILIQTYTADFGYYLPSRKIVVEDVKSPVTAKKRDFRRTMKLMKALYGIDVEVVTKC